MATYLPGVTDYLPQIQPFQPDYNFLSNVLQTKQSQYDAAHKQLSSVYGTLLNSPMLRDQNIQRREEFFKAVDQDIQRMSGMDLSLQQNQDAAMQVFKGFYEDQNMVKDMVWTKNYMNEVKRADAFKDCVDPKKCGGQWWEGGMKALNYKAQEFKMASDQEALNFQNVSFVPGQNMTDEAIKLAKESGFNVKFDEIKGDWIVTTKNGTRMIQPLAEFYMSKFGSDPKYMEYYKTQAYVKRKDWVSQNMTNFADENEANLGYVTNMYQETLASVQAAKKQADAHFDLTKNVSDQIDEHIRKKGYIPSMGLLTEWQDLKDEHAVAVQNKTIYDQASDQVKALGYNKDNIKFVLDAMDGMVGLNMLRADALNSASAYSQLTMEQTIKANPYAVQAKNHAFQMSLHKMSEGYIDPQTGQYVPGTKFAQAKLLKEMQWQHEEEVKQATLKKLGLLDDNYHPTTEGGAAGKMWSEKQEQSMAYNDNKSKRNQANYRLDQTKQEVVSTTLGEFQAMFEQQKLAGVPEDEIIKKLARPLRTITGSTNIREWRELLDLSSEGHQAAQAKAEKYFKGIGTHDAWDGLQKFINPTSGEGILHNDWNFRPEFYQKMEGYNATLKQTREFISEFDKFANKVGEKALNTTLADINTRASEEGKHANDDLFVPSPSHIFKQDFEGNTPEASAFKYISSKVSRAGFQPDFMDVISSDKEGMRKMLGGDSEKIYKAATEWAKTHVHRFKDEPDRVEDVYQYGARTPSGRVKVGTKVVEGEKAYDRALKFALDSYKDNLSVYKAAYADQDGNHWTNVGGTKGNAYASMVYRGNLDAAVTSTTSANDFMDMARNYNRLKTEPGVIVNYGNNFISKPEETDATAKAILDAFITDFGNGAAIDYKQGIIRDKKRAAGDFAITRIAGHDPNYVGFSIVPTQQWADQYMSKSSKAVNLIPYGDEKWKEGIVVYMPKKQVQADYLNRTEVTEDDFIMEHRGQISISNPNGGSVYLNKTSAGNYNVQFTTIEIDPTTGEPTTRTTTAPLGPDISITDFKQAYQANLDWLAMLNIQNLQMAAQTNGIKDPAQLFNR